MHMYTLIRKSSATPAVIFVVYESSYDLSKVIKMVHQIKYFKMLTRVFHWVLLFILCLYIFIWFFHW